MGGRNVSLIEARALRDDVSTDEITPLASLVYFDERLGRYPYTGVKCGDRLPIGVDAIRNGGFGVTVAGNRYGKGSSREHSPAAELRAGIRLVIAKKFRAHLSAERGQPRAVYVDRLWADRAYPSRRGNPDC